MTGRGGTDPGKIILLDGASSSGKSTIARAAQAQLSEPFWHYSIDHLRAAKVLPHDRIRSGEFPWPGLRPAFFDGFHRSIPALVGAGNNLIVEHIVETADWMASLLELLGPFDVFFVAVRCPLGELERRERSRGDRPIGDARADAGIVHSFGEYDLELDSTRPPESSVEQLISAWRARPAMGAFARMAASC